MRVMGRALEIIKAAAHDLQIAFSFVLFTPSYTKWSEKREKREFHTPTHTDAPLGHRHAQDREDEHRGIHRPEEVYALRVYM